MYENFAYKFEQERYDLDLVERYLKEHRKG